MEARFFNPYSVQMGSWSSGLLFRYSEYDVFQIVVITSSGYWYHYLSKGSVEQDQLRAHEWSAHIATGAYDYNDVRIIALGTEGDIVHQRSTTLPHWI